MCGTLDQYLSSFARIRVDRSRGSWTALTNRASPYKPFLLLSILDHIASGQITKNFIEPSFELTETFQEYIALLPHNDRKASMSYPFYHLESSDFWEMIPRFGEEHRKGRSISSMKRLRELYLGARFNKDLFMLLQMEHAREKLRAVLVQTYFSPAIQPTIWQQSMINCGSTKYAFGLLGTSEVDAGYLLRANAAECAAKVRDQGFRKAIVRLYAHRCALCGIKMLTSEGRTVVDAAHIIPFSENRNDHPTNGMALCKLCHWSFDEGLMSVDTHYDVMVSPAVKKDPNLPGHILTLSDRPIFRPTESRFWPAQESFAWHRKQRFRKRD
ncbi:HNH endonuclease [Desulfopila sp. IMCC35006]|uniref:HNH endonuclease n=1 Tax=Desulfopila sp. IMCC35006 TaxID=2569542 RepID=UPI0010ABFB46|nr:HNH endonuclease [Desulfopila sp. IMCC35006]TKB25146.1 HNH endonuclease [Desulfopila sp. IMCC35006]